MHVYITVRDDQSRCTKGVQALQPLSEGAAAADCDRLKAESPVTETKVAGPSIASLESRFPRYRARSAATLHGILSDQLPNHASTKTISPSTRAVSPCLKGTPSGTEVTLGALASCGATTASTQAASTRAMLTAMP